MKTRVSNILWPIVVTTSGLAVLFNVKLIIFLWKIIFYKPGKLPKLFLILCVLSLSSLWLFSILTRFLFFFPISFSLFRRWQFPGYALISLLVNHFSISFIEVSDDSNTELGCHQRHGWLVLKYLEQLPRGTKKRLAHGKWRSVVLKLIRAASNTKLLPISWLNYHSVLPFREGGRKILGWLRELLNWVFEWGLVHMEGLQKCN